jgi:hypothetical protein
MQEEIGTALYTKTQGGPCTSSTNSTQRTLSYD